MKNYKCTKENPTEIKLDDCLACSGCLSDNEYSRFGIDLTVLDNYFDKINFIFTEFSKKDLYWSYCDDYREIDYNEFEISLINTINKKYNTINMVDSSNFTKTQKGINSYCPAVVLYVERMYPQLTKYLNRDKTQIQQAIEYLKTKNNERIIVVSQCYDKKEEILREKYEDVHLVGAIDFYAVIKKDLEENKNIFIENKNIDKIALLNENNRDNNVISGQVDVFNELSKYKANDFLNVYWCRGGCQSGPCIANKTKETTKSNDSYVKSNNSNPLIPYTSKTKRIFTPSKKKTFQIEW